MTIKEFITLLSQYPSELTVYYRDVTYGGPDVEVESTDIEESRLPETNERVILIH